MKKITLEQSVVQGIIRKHLEAGYDFSREQGGVLLGRREGEFIHVDNLAGLRNRSKVYHKYNSGWGLLKLLVRNCFRSGNKAEYLGNWHFHVSDDALPSNQDIETMKKQCRIFRSNLLMLIVCRNMSATITQFEYVGSWRGFKRFVGYETLEVRELI